MSNQTFVVDRLMVGDGSTDKSTRTIEKGKLYGATGLYGGNESFWPVSEGHIKVSLASLAALSKITFSSMTASEKIKVQQRLLTTLLDWMQKNRGVPVVVGGVGARGHIRNTRHFQVHKYGPNLVSRNEGSCVPESVVNATNALLGKQAAQGVHSALRAAPKMYGSLKQLFSVLHHLPTKLTTRRVSKTEEETFKKNLFKWVASLNKGVWLLRLTQHGLVDHCVAIDANRGIIHDSAARYPFILCETILKRLGGDEAKKLRIEEIRELLQVKINIKKRSGKKRARE